MTCADRLWEASGCFQFSGRSKAAEHCVAGVPGLAGSGQAPPNDVELGFLIPLTTGAVGPQVSHLDPPGGEMGTCRVRAVRPAASGQDARAVGRAGLRSVRENAGEGDPSGEDVKNAN